MSFSLKNIIKIIIVSTIIAGFYSCENISTPIESNQELKIKTEKKWALNPLSNSKLYVVKVKEYDVKGNLMFMEEYNSNGTINSNSTYTYDQNNSSQENKKIFNSDGSSKNLKIEYIYNEAKKVTKKIEYDTNGKITAVFEYQYDNKGNLIQKNEKNQTGGTVSVDYDYTYNPNGDLIERKIINNGAVVNRDSLTYNASNNSLDVINIDNFGTVESKTTFYYNQRGEINFEVETSSLGIIPKKYLYEYTYYSK